MAKDFTKIVTNLMLDTKDMAEWGIKGGHTTVEKLRLTVAARQEQAKKLVADGMSQRKAAKLLGISEGQVRRDVARTKDAKSATKVRKPTKQKAITPIDRCTMTIRSTVLEIMREMSADEWHDLFVALRDELDDLEKVAEKRKPDGHYPARQSS